MKYQKFIIEREGLEVGLSRDLIYHVGRSFGFYLNDGKDLVSWIYSWKQWFRFNLFNIFCNMKEIYQEKYGKEF